MVMTSPEWWKTAKMLQYVDSQAEFSQYNTHLDKYSAARTSTCGTHKETIGLNSDSCPTCKCSQCISEFQKAGDSTNQVSK